MQEEVGGEAEGMRQERLGRKVHLTGKNRQEDAGGSKRQETNKQQAGGRQEAGRRHAKRRIRRKGAFDRQE